MLKDLDPPLTVACRVEGCGSFSFVLAGVYRCTERTWPRSMARPHCIPASRNVPCTTLYAAGIPLFPRSRVKAPGTSRFPGPGQASRGSALCLRTPMWTRSWLRPTWRHQSDPWPRKRYRNRPRTQDYTPTLTPTKAPTLIRQGPSLPPVRPRPHSPRHGLPALLCICLWVCVYLW